MIFGVLDFSGRSISLKGCDSCEYLRLIQQYRNSLKRKCFLASKIKRKRAKKANENLISKITDSLTRFASKNLKLPIISKFMWKCFTAAEPFWAAKIPRLNTWAVYLQRFNHYQVA